MPRTASLQLQVHPNLQAAFAKLYPTGRMYATVLRQLAMLCRSNRHRSGVIYVCWLAVESFLAAQEFLTVPEDTGDLQFTQQVLTCTVLLGL